MNNKEAIYNKECRGFVRQAVEKFLAQEEALRISRSLHSMSLWKKYEKYLNDEQWQMFIGH